MGIIVGMQFARYVKFSNLSITKTPLSYWFSYVATLVILFGCVYILSLLPQTQFNGNGSLYFIIQFIVVILPIYPSYKYISNKTRKHEKNV